MTAWQGLARSLVDRLPFREVLLLRWTRWWTRLSPGDAWKVLLVLLILANLKSLPLAWHARFFHGLFTHLPFRRPWLLRPRRQMTAASIGPAALFRPVITSSYTTLMECDINGHKSNSTYFSDLDISRAHLLFCLMAEGIRREDERVRDDHATSEATKTLPKMAIHLGGVSCIFRSEIKPYQNFETWSRLLSWDRKWMYFVSHLVKKDAVTPKAYLLQPDGPPRRWWFAPGRRRRTVVSGKRKDVTSTAPAQGPPTSAIYASSISRYVAKRGRITIEAEQILKSCGLLPPKPTSTDEDASASMPTPDDERADADDDHDIDALLHASLEAEPRKSAGDDHKDDDSDVWNWSRVEAERQRGLRLASLLTGLEGLHDTFTGDQEPALGEYADLI